jgi:transcriptional regulator with XRE-family HTH domain
MYRESGAHARRLPWQSYGRGAFGVRHDAGLTQVQVARKMSRPQSFGSKIESGERRVDFVELQYLASSIGSQSHFLRSAITMTQRLGRPSQLSCYACTGSFVSRHYTPCRESKRWLLRGRETRRAPITTRLARRLSDLRSKRDAQG